MEMFFGDAIRMLRASPEGTVKMTRRGWNGRGMWINLHRPIDEPFCQPYIEMFTADRRFVPWTASQTDMLSDDWEVFYSKPGLHDYMTFGDVLKALETEPQARFTRLEWTNGGDMDAYIGLQLPDEGSLNDRPYLFFVDHDGRLPFTPGPNSMFADDWFKVTAEDIERVMDACIEDCVDDSDPWEGKRWRAPFPGWPRATAPAAWRTRSSASSAPMRISG